MPRIHQYVAMNGVQVPQAEDGRFLDPHQVRGDEAPVLTSPHGPLHFFVGDRNTKVLLDYAVLPDGRVAVTAKPYKTPKRLRDAVPVEAVYFVRAKDKVLPDVWRLVEDVVEALESVGVKHDFEEFVADPFYFFRAVAAECGVKPYCLMDGIRLRSEDTL